MKVFTKSEGEPTSVAKVGQVIESGNWSYQVTNVDRQKEVPGLFGSKTEAKGIWAAVHLKLKNIGKQTYPINAHDFEVKDVQGITFKADTVTSGTYNRNLKLVPLGDQLPPGVEVESAVLFDVNPQTTGLQLWLVQARMTIDFGT